MIKFVLGLVAVLIFFAGLSQITNHKTQIPNNIQIPITKIQNTPRDNRKLTIEDGEKKIEDRRLKAADFPFTVQAPDGSWDNPIFQDGCEESSVLMIQCVVGSWQCPVKEGFINNEWAKAEIIKMSEWEKEKYGSSTDTSAADTAERLLKNYYNFSNFSLLSLATSRQLIDGLESGVWIVPMDGRKLGNPYYTAPGPERHMIPVIGYDEKTDEVITNDPGTKRGKGYRYKLEVFWNAIRDYPTGEHEPIAKIDKNAIFVKL